MPEIPSNANKQVIKWQQLAPMALDFGNTAFGSAQELSVRLIDTIKREGSPTNTFISLLETPSYKSMAFDKGSQHLVDGEVLDTNIATAYTKNLYRRINKKINENGEKITDAQGAVEYLMLLQRAISVEAAKKKNPTAKELCIARIKMAICWKS